MRGPSNDQRRGRPRAALYARVSTVGKGQDAALQVEELQAAAVQRGWFVVGSYVDEGISGAKNSRPELDRLMADAQAARFDLVAVWKLDRLGRSIQHVLALLDQFSTQGIEFVSLRDVGLDTTTPSGRLFTAIIAAFADFEREIIRERVVAGIRRAQAQGKHCGRPKTKVDPRPATALLHEGRSLREVADILGVSRSTLRRRLREGGAWPLPNNMAAEE